MIKNNIPQTPQDWQIHDDAYTLLRAAEVRQDEGRLKAALRYVETLAEETQNAANAANSLVKESKKLNGGV